MDFENWVIVKIYEFKVDPNLVGGGAGALAPPPNLDGHILRTYDIIVKPQI